MRRRIKTVVKDMSGLGLSKAMGCSQSYIVQIQQNHPDAWVYLENGEPVRIEYKTNHVLHRKRKKK